MNDIFANIKKSFNSLWHARMRGRSLEVITPFPAAEDKYVSVFILEQNGRYIVTDGGWLDEGTYTIGKEEPDLSRAFEKIMDYFINNYDVLRTRTSSGKVICFKSVSELKFIPNIVFDMANFISVISSTAVIPLKEEAERRNTFRTRAHRFILDCVGHDRLQSNSLFTEQAPAARFNAIVKMPQSQSTLVNYVTGSTTDYMTTSYCKSNTMFDLLHNSDAEPSVKDKIIIMDDSAEGFNENLMRDFFEMSMAKGRTNILWTKDEKQLQKLIG